MLQAGQAPIMSTKEVAQRLGLSVQTVRRLYKSGELPGQMVGGRVLVFSRRDVEALVSQGPHRKTA